MRKPVASTYAVLLVVGVLVLGATFAEAQEQARSRLPVVSRNGDIGATPLLDETRVAIIVDARVGAALTAAVPTVTPTATPVPTSTIATPTNQQYTRGPMDASSWDSDAHAPGRAIDADLTTYWQPAASDSAPQLAFNLNGSQQISWVRVATSLRGGTATYQVLLYRPVPQPTATATNPTSTPTNFTPTPTETACGSPQQITADYQVIQVACGAYTDVRTVIVRIAPSQSSGVQAGVREINVYGP